MAEISSDEPPPAVPGRQNPPRAPITDIKQWLEKYSLMAAVLVSRFPEKAPELFAYQATIIRAERNYEGQQWVEYDRQFRREALAGKSLDWSIPNHRLYQEAFTGRARNIPRYSYCVQDDHTSELCTKNPARACFGWPAGFLVWPAVQPPPPLFPPKVGRSPPQSHAAASTAADALPSGADTRMPAQNVAGGIPRETALVPARDCPQELVTR